MNTHRKYKNLRVNKADGKNKISQLSALIYGRFVRCGMPKADGIAILFRWFWRSVAGEYAMNSGMENGVFYFFRWPKRFQLGLVLKLFIVFTLFGAILSLIFYYSFWPTMTDYVPFALITELNKRIICRIVWICLPFALIMLGGAVLLTHKIAGPAYNMEKTLDRLLMEGDSKCI